MTACVLALGLLAGCATGPPGLSPSMLDPVPVRATSQAAAVALRPAFASDGPVDRWFAPDKVRHFAMSFAATNFAYAGARFPLDPDAAFIVAGATALALGVGKEVHDARAGRWFSLKDMVWNAAGVALGLTFVHRIR